MDDSGAAAEVRVYGVAVESVAGGDGERRHRHHVGDTQAEHVAVQLEHTLARSVEVFDGTLNEDVVHPHLGAAAKQETAAVTEHGGEAVVSVEELIAKGAEGSHADGWFGHARWRRRRGRTGKRRQRTTRWRLA